MKVHNMAAIFLYPSVEDEAEGITNYRRYNKEDRSFDMIDWFCPVSSSLKYFFDFFRYRKYRESFSILAD